MSQVTEKELDLIAQQQTIIGEQLTTMQNWMAKGNRLIALRQQRGQLLQQINTLDEQECILQIQADDAQAQLEGQELTALEARAAGLLQKLGVE